MQSAITVVKLNKSEYVDNEASDFLSYLQSASPRMRQNRFVSAKCTQHVLSLATLSKDFYSFSPPPQINARNEP
jgi:hypothetical protein